MLEVHNVTFNYSTQGEQDAPPALQNVSLRFREGETVAILGQNGSGKSTLAKLLAAILQPDEGSILVDDLDTTARGEDLWTIRQRVGLVFQNPDDQLVASTVLDDIAFGPENIGLPRFEIQERVDEAIALLGLEAYRQMASSELSVGQKQRVAVAGVLAMRPRYLILDEPTTMISGQTARHLLATVQRLARERGIAVIHITHYMHEAATFDRAIVLDAGRVVMDDMPAAIFARTEELQAIGLDVPIVTRVGQYLSAHGVLQETLLSVEHLRDVVKDMRQGRPRGDALPTYEPVDISYGRNVPLQVPFAQSLIFELQNVAYTYSQGTPLEREALHNLSLTIPKGCTTALVGATHAGKSTVVDLLACLLKATKGSVLFEGENVASKTFAIERIRSQVGVVFQSPESQIFEETVGKDVSFGLRHKKIPLAESRRLVQESLEAVGLSYEDFRLRYTYALSGGQKRRVAIAGVLALQPQVIILDEPMAGLDPRGRRELLRLIAELKQREGLTIVYASSSLEDVIELADYIHILDAGRLVASGSSHEILARANELQALDITLPEATRIVLALQDVVPGLRIDIRTLEELEKELSQVLPHIKNMKTV